MVSLQRPPPLISRLKETYRIAIECDSPYAVAVTGVRVARQVRGSRTRHVFEETHPMATYLAAVHVGQYDEVAVQLPRRVGQRLKESERPDAVRSRTILNQRAPPALHPAMISAHCR